MICFIVILSSCKIHSRAKGIRDNVSSHLTDDDLKSCRENNTSFVMPPFATHLCQPLHVAFFAPFKKGWREILTKWKKENRFVDFSKSFFNVLGKERKRRNAINGCAACGIESRWKERSLQKLLSSHTTDESD